MSEQRDLQIKIVQPTLSETESDKALFALFDLLLKIKVTAEPKEVTEH